MTATRAFHELRLHDGRTVLHAAWSGPWRRDDYRRGVLDWAALAQAHGAHHLLADLRGLQGHADATADKFYLGCLLVALLPGMRAAVLLPKARIQGVLASVTGGAGVPMRSFWDDDRALSWLLED